MTVTVQQIMTGIGNYFDNEIAQQMQGIQKWIARAAVTTAAAKAPEIIEPYKPYMQKANIMTENGMIDADRLRDLFLEQARATGPVRQNFPLIGPVTFTEHDIESLYRHITGG